MESKVSSNCTRNIHRPSTPEKEVNRKENTVERLPKGDRFESLSMLRLRRSKHAHGEDLFHYVMFCYKENRDLSSTIHRVSFGGIS